MAELLAYSVIEAGARELGELADRVDEAQVEGGAGCEGARQSAVDGDVDRLAARGVADGEDILWGDHKGAGGERMRRDVADHVALRAPGEDRALVGEVVARRAGRRRRDEAVAAHIADLLAGDPVAQLGHAVGGTAAEADVVEGEVLRIADLDPERRQVDRLGLPGQGATDSLLGLVTL